MDERGQRQGTPKQHALPRLGRSRTQASQGTSTEQFDMTSPSTRIAACTTDFR